MSVDIICSKQYAGKIWRGLQLFDRSFKGVLWSSLCDIATFLKDTVNAPAKVSCASPLSPPPGHAQDFDRGPSDYIGDPDNSNSFWPYSDITNGRSIDVSGDSDWKYRAVRGFWQTFSVKIPLVSLGGSGFTLTHT